MAESTITSKGQTTVPAEIRQRLGAGPGTRLIWHMEPGNSTIIVRAKTKSIRDLAGTLKSRLRKPVPIDAMNPWR